ncbi:phage tail protein [Shewanella sp.]|uniref:phage tail protein n=1 Tax=Shewanella sp. TaxID=50422 RepID=UPI001EB332EC|nr:phage tail protein [Shewanella sp.]NRB23820.1 phage tail protein [Shewanella sp.]
MSVLTKTQLQLITEFLLTSLGSVIKANDIDAWQEHGTLILTGDDLGLQGFSLAKWKHSAVISIERFPHRKLNPYSLLAMVAAYLIDNGGERDTFQLADPELDIDVISKDHAQVLIQLELIDNIEVIPDANGSILFNGQQYRIDLAPVNVAETIDTVVTIDSDSGGDA